jgi:hypothetical protein
MNITTDSPITVISSLNDVSGGLLGLSLLVILWLVVYMRNRDEPVREAVSGATFITSIVGMLFGFLGLISGKAFIVLFFLMAGSIILLINKPDR